MTPEKTRDALDVALWRVVENQRTNGGNGGGLVGIMAALRNAILFGVDLGDGLVLMVGEPSPEPCIRCGASGIGASGDTMSICDTCGGSCEVDTGLFFAVTAEGKVRADGVAYPGFRVRDDYCTSVPHCCTPWPLAAEHEVHDGGFECGRPYGHLGPHKILVGPPCGRCGGREFHTDGCPDRDVTSPPGSDEYIEWEADDEQ